MRSRISARADRHLITHAQSQIFELFALAMPAEPDAGAQGSIQQTPGGLIATPPVEAVTEPIGIPTGGE